MRILQICQRPQRRGAEIFAYQLSRELKRRGHEVSLMYLYPHPGTPCLEVGPDDRLLQGNDAHPLETTVGIHPGLLREVRAVIKEFRPEVVQVNGARTVKYGVLARSLDGDATGRLVYRNIGAPADWIRGVRRRLFYRAILARVDGVVAISRRSLAALDDAVPRRVKRTVISNGIDPTELRPRVERSRVRASEATPSVAPVVVFVGSLTREKRVDRLVRAVGETRRQGVDLHLWLVGDGPLRARLQAQAGRAGLGGNVRFFGVRSDVASCLAAADFLALVSDTEGIPGVVLEAGCLGLPVLATRVGGLPECVVEGRTGFLVEPGDEEALVARMIRLAEEPALRSELGRAARARILEIHAISPIAGRYLRFYEEVLG